MLSRSISTSIPPFATGGSGALAIVARRSARSLMVSELAFTLSLRDTCEDLLREKFVLDRFAPPWRIEQDWNALSSRAADAVALMDPRLEHDRTEDPENVTPGVAGHDPGLLVEGPERAEQPEARIGRAPQRIDGRLRPQRAGNARRLEPDRKQHVRTRDHRIHGQHSERRRAVRDD